MFSEALEKKIPRIRKNFLVKPSSRFPLTANELKKNLWPLFDGRDCSERGNESKVCEYLMTLHFLVTLGGPLEGRSKKLVHVGRCVAVASSHRSFLDHK